MSTHNIPFLNIKKENHPKLFQICNYGIGSKGPKNEFEPAKANEPSVFEALKFYCKNVASDLVLAVRSLSWPDCASEWLVRERHYNWPSQEQIDKCKTLGCFFVQVGHPKSDEYHLQWRISFSLQERLLDTDFNSVHLKCYILLKMMKKERVHKSLGEKSLTSYHFKTCMLYMIENTPGEF